tara:strand:- start:360 stop:956 length:597 start_codon:yes stop_codon:yes gene_type:complete
MLIAYHEVGHALVAALTPLADKVDKISLLPRDGGIGGFTRFWPDEEVVDSGLVSKAYLFSKILVYLGGRAAEIVVFGDSEVTQGASNDLRNVNVLAREMVTKFGFSKLGPQSINTNTNEVFLGRDLINTRTKYSEATNKVIDEEVRKIAFLAMKKALKILNSNRSLMDKLVDLLIQQETIDSSKFNEILTNELQFKDK